MKCLSCNEEMYNYTVSSKDDSISYDVCEACGGMWLDRGELDKMAFKVEGSVEFSSEKEAEEDDKPTRKCPRCPDKDLDKVYFISYSDVVLDHCDACGGFWLDGGELEKINKELGSMKVPGNSFSDFIKNSHFPYWKKRIRRKSSEVDFKTEIKPIKGSHKTGLSSYKCPIHKDTLMDIYNLAGVEFEGCPEGGGIYLDVNELRQLKDKVNEKTWRNLRWMDDEIEAIESSISIPSNRFCPKCEMSQMVAVNFGKSDILIDWCSECHGLWLDRNEFQEIINYLEKRLDNMTSEEMKENLKQEFKEIWDGPQFTTEEIGDAVAALGAFLNITIFEHPTLAKIMMGAAEATRKSGLA